MDAPLSFGAAMRLHYSDAQLAAAGVQTQAAYLEWLLESPVSQLGLPTREVAGLESLGISTLGELLSTKPDKLRTKTLIGETAVVRIVSAARRAVATGELSGGTDGCPDREQIRRGCEDIATRWTEYDEWTHRVTRCERHVSIDAGLPDRHWGGQLYG